MLKSMYMYYMYIVYLCNYFKLKMESLITVISRTYFFSYSIQNNVGLYSFKLQVCIHYIPKFPDENT